MVGWVDTPDRSSNEYVVANANSISGCTPLCKSGTDNDLSR